MKQIPKLSGKAYRLYCFVWVIAFLVALASTYDTISYTVKKHTAAQIYSALGIKFNDQDLWRNVSPLNNENTSGIGASDEILAIDGKPITSLTSAISVAKGDDGSIVTLKLRERGRDEVRVVTVTRNSEHVEKYFKGSRLKHLDVVNAILLFSSIPTLAWLVVCVLLFRHRSREPVAALIAIGPLFLAFSLPSFFSQSLATPINYFGFATVMAGLLLFPNARIFKPWTWIGLAYILILFVSSIALWLSGFGQPVRPVYILALFVGVIVIQVINYLRLLQDDEKQQLKYVLLGVVAAFLAFGLAILTFRAGGLGIVEIGVWQLLGLRFFMNVGLTAIPVGILIALLRYRLFDANFVLSLSSTYALMTVLIGFGFFVVERAIDQVADQFIGNSFGAISISITAALAAVLIGPIHTSLVQWSKRRFQHDLVRLHEGLPETVADMQQNESVEDIVSTILSEIAHAVDAKHLAIVFLGDFDRLHTYEISDQLVKNWIQDQKNSCADQKLEIDRTDDRFPMRVSLELKSGTKVARLLLGPRVDGSFYNRDQCKTLSQLVYPVARALLYAQRREVEKGDLKREIEDLRARIESAETKLENIELEPGE